MAWTSVEFFPTGDGYYESVLRAVASARKSILLEKYIFRYDHMGKAILEALAAARGRGVRVFLRIDGVGAREEIPAIQEFCALHKLELEVFHPLPFANALRSRHLARIGTFLRRWRLMNRRSHRKLIVIDEEVAYAGGRNVDDCESESRTGAEAWHDLSVRVEGPPLEKLVRAFWLWPFRRQPSRDFLLNSNWLLKLTRNTWFLRHIQASRRRVWVVTPYFAPTPAMLYQLRLAARRGVDVRLVLPSRIDVPLSRLAARALYRHLLAWGVRIFEFQPRILHRKLWLIDDLCVAGSGNLNHRSFIHDLEIEIVLRQEAHVNLGSALFLADQAQAREILKADLAQLSVWQRVLYWLASWLVYWL